MDEDMWAIWRFLIDCKHEGFEVAKERLDRHWDMRLKYLRVMEEALHIRED